MKSYQKKITLVSLSAVLICFATFITISACAKEKTSKVVGSFITKDWDPASTDFLLDGFEKPKDGFICKFDNRDNETTHVLIGTEFDDFVNTLSFRGTNLVDQTDVLYTFEEDLNVIRFSNQTSQGFDMEIYGEIYRLFDLSDCENGIVFNIESPSNNHIRVLFYQDSIDAKTFLDEIAEVDVVGNPFLPNGGMNTGTKDWIKPILKYGKKIFKGIVVITVLDLASDLCKESLENDRYNCEKKNKCTKRSGLCSYDCIDCNQAG